MVKSKLARHAYEEGRRVSWKEVRVVQTVSDDIRKKYKELAHVACIFCLISLSNLDVVNFVWSPVIKMELSHYSAFLGSFATFRNSS